MPIRPENKDRYPDDWPAISRAAKQAAAWRCACTAFDAVAIVAVPAEPVLPPALPAVTAPSCDEPLPWFPQPAPTHSPSDFEGAPLMARITATIKPVHADGSVCPHKLTSAGKPKEAGCAGRHGYTATCSACLWTDTNQIRAALEYVRAAHLRSHLTQPATPASV